MKAPWIGIIHRLDKHSNAKTTSFCIMIFMLSIATWGGYFFTEENISKIALKYADE
jgi:hypothetical protein